MAQVINTNIASLNAQRNLNSSQNALNTSLERLSSGLRINSAKDDSAGLAISERMTSQIRGLNQATRNANDGVSLAQTAEGAMGEIGNNLQRIRELAVQSANATNSASDRKALQAEVNQLVAEIDRVATQTDFNGTKLLDGSFTAQAFQVGANAGQTINIDQITSARSSALGKGTGFTLQNQAIGTVTGSATSLNLGVGHSVNLGTLDSDAKSIAAAINNSGIAGLSATANATKAAGVTADASAVSVNGNATVTINNVAITVAATNNATSNVANALDAINAQSSVTGVRAVDTGSGLDLIAQDGRNIDLAVATGTATGATAVAFGLNATATTRSTINVSYSGQALGTNNAVTFSGATGTINTNISDTGTALNAIDVSDVAGANATLASVDAALQTINSSRADLGAMQNRFSSVITNLQTNAENLSSSRSRIQDADFASETAALTRGQILQQAGVAMLAQANALPNNVLSLLR